MQAIMKGTVDPCSMLGHAEEDILRNCVRNVLKRTAPTHMIKVKGHAGITGNEMADKVAEKARLTSRPPRYSAISEAQVELELYITVEGYVLTNLSVNSLEDVKDKARVKIGVVDPNGSPLKAALIHQTFASNAKEAVLDAENDRRRKVASGTSTENPSIAFRWLEGAKTNDYVSPALYGVNKVRINNRHARDLNRARMTQQGSRHHVW